jgi:hypothetical protein
MKPIAIAIVFLAVVGLVVLLGAPAGFTEDTVRIGSYVESIPGFTGVHKYLPKYHPNWHQCQDLGKAQVSIDTHAASIHPSHKFSEDYYPQWQLPTTVEVTQPHTEEYTAQMPAFGAFRMFYVEPELYIEQ